MTLREYIRKYRDTTGWSTHRLARTWAWEYTTETKNAFWEISQENIYEMYKSQKPHFVKNSFPKGSYTNLSEFYSKDGIVHFAKHHAYEDHWHLAKSNPRFCIRYEYFWIGMCYAEILKQNEIPEKLRKILNGIYHYGLEKKELSYNQINLILKAWVEHIEPDAEQQQLTCPKNLLDMIETEMDIVNEVNEENEEERI